MTKTFSKALFLDAGHGGIDPKTGLYTTGSSKVWTHNRGLFHKGSTFYEGVSNRVFAEILFQMLTDSGVNVVKVYHPFLDTSLTARTTIANAYHNQIQNGLYFSLHSNAVNRQDAAKGLSIWTTTGTTQSDVLASDLFAGWRRDLNLEKYGTTFREDRSDGDADYEENFAVLRNSNMPAVLVENLFFDNWNDSNILINKDYQREFCKSTHDTLLKHLE